MDMERITRRALLTSCFAAGTLLPLLRAEDTKGDPWSKDELMEPEALARALAAPGHRSAPAIIIISVVFPVLYRERHIPNARFAGPASKPEGIAALKAAVSQLPKDTPIVIYCGCCPMVRCPNIRPAYRTLKDLGYRDVRVLDLPTNFHTDWTVKGYPVEPPVSHAL